MMETGEVSSESSVCFQATWQREKVEATKKDDMGVLVCSNAEV